MFKEDVFVEAVEEMSTEVQACRSLFGMISRQLDIVHTLMFWEAPDCKVAFRGQLGFAIIEQVLGCALETDY